MKAVILAAGKGTRMMPLTEDKPKVMVEVNGKPFLSYVINNLRQAQITELCLVVGYKYQKIIRFLAEENIDATLAFQTNPQGTGEAIQLAEFFTRGSDFIVVSGDNLFSPFDIHELANKEGNWVSGIESDTPEKYGVLQTEENTLKQIIEKPTQYVGNLVNVGLYRFTSEIYSTLNQIGRSSRGEYELPDAINLLTKETTVSTYKLSFFWKDFGCPEDVKRMEQFLSERGEA